MPRAADVISSEDRQRIARAVADTESRTAAEVLPAVAAESGRYDRAEDIVGLWTGLVFMVVTWFLLPPLTEAPGSWSGMPAWMPPVALALAVVSGFVLGTVGAARVGGLRRLFTPRRQMQEEVLGRARQVFTIHRVHRTVGATGLLVYVSLLERMAAIVADQALLEKLGPETLNQLCDTLTADLRTTSVAEAMCRTIRSTGELLAAALPRAEDDVNELDDALVLLD